MLRTFKSLILRGIVSISIFALLLCLFSPISVFAQEDEQGGALFPITFELWIEDTGAGRAELRLQVPQEYIEQGFTLEYFLQTMELPETVEITKTEDLGGGNWLIEYKWPSVESFGEEVKKNPDGSYTFNFTSLQFFSKVIIHIEGKILQTNGQKVNSNTVVFSGMSEGTVTFFLGGAPPTLPPSTTPPTTPPTTRTPPPTTPPTGFTPPTTPPTGSPPPTTPPTASPSPSGGGLSTTWIIIIAFGGLFLIALIVLIVSLTMRKKRPPQAGYPYAPPPPPPPQAGPAPGYMFCPNCGKQVQQGAKFCTFCGFQIGAPTPPQAPPPESPPPPPPEVPQS